MHKLHLFIIFLLITILVGGYLLSNPFQQKNASKPIGEPSLEVIAPQSNSESKQRYEFSNPKKSAHYETNTPNHGSTLAGVPVNVVIDFNFDLAAPSDISIINNGQEYGLGETLIDKNKLALRRKVDLNAPDGLYTVSYKACWPDQSCHDGSFQFAVDSSLAASYQNLTGQKNVTIKLSDLMFNPKNIKITKGTTVSWENDDTEIHYVNADSHPAHTYFSDQNSKALNKGDKFTLTFSTSGVYPYHCSAHADAMMANVLVE